MAAYTVLAYRRAVIIWELKLMYKWNHCINENWNEVEINCPELNHNRNRNICFWSKISLAFTWVSLLVEPFCCAVIWLSVCARSGNVTHWSAHKCFRVIPAPCCACNMITMSSCQAPVMLQSGRSIDIWLSVSVCYGCQVVSLLLHNVYSTIQYNTWLV